MAASACGVRRAAIRRRCRPNRARSPHEVKPLLTREDPPTDPFGVEPDLLFLRHAHGLAVPLGNGARHLKLRREPAVRANRYVAACRDAFLPVPQTDQRPGPMAVIADGMGVDRAIESFGAHPRERCTEG